MKTFTSRRARLSAVITGKAREAGPIEAHEKNVLAITRRIHSLSLKAAKLRKELEATRSELRFKRRELRAVLQRDSTIRGEDDPALNAGGKSDAIDAAERRRE